MYFQQFSFQNTTVFGRAVTTPIVPRMPVVLVNIFGIRAQTTPSGGGQQNQQEGVFTRQQINIINAQLWDANHYANFFSDIRNAFDSDQTAIWNHFLQFVLISGNEPHRISGFSPIFDPTYYLSRYEDLQLAFDNSPILALQHFVNFGMSEGRSAHPSTTPATSSDDNQPATIMTATINVVATSEGGTVFGSGTYSLNDWVTLTAVPHSYSGWRFASWRDEQWNIISFEQTLQLQVTHDRTIFADFEQQSRHLNTPQSTIAPIASNGEQAHTPAPARPDLASWHPGQAPLWPSAGITQSWSNGGVFVGNVVNGQLNGWGTIWWPNGDVFQGEWVNDQRTWGTYWFASGAIYQGDHVNSNEMTGQGTFWWTDGTVYQGSFVNGQRTGYGTMWWTNGQVYQGEFASGHRIGWGTYWNANSTTNIYQGNWSYGFWGQGTKSGWGVTRWMSSGNLQFGVVDRNHFEAQ
jgi:hypothetical protein